MTPATPSATTSTTTVVHQPGKLDQILAFLEVGSEWAGALLPPGSPPALIDAALSKLLRIAQAAVAAHESISGEPLDLEKLHEIDHVA